MNMLDTYVTNITYDEELPNGSHKLICDTSCWGEKHQQTTIVVTAGQYYLIKRDGYFQS